MRVSREEMERSHERIVDGAASLFRERGVENTSVADVMESAGLTHGGFYRHFATKDALLSAALRAAFAQLQDVADRNLRGKDSETALARYHAFYLSDAHLGNPGGACPVATLAGDVARAAPPLKEEFGQGVMRLLETLTNCQSGPKRARQAAAIREFAMLVGAAVIARASDPETAQTILTACRPQS